MFDFFKEKTVFGPINLIIADHLRQLQQRKSLIPEDVFDVTIFSLEEIRGVFNSMDILVQNEDYARCIKLSRSIFKNSINIQYIYQKDSEERAKNFKLTSLKGIQKNLNF